LKSRLTRPLLAVAVGGALLAGSAAVAGSAFAAPVPGPARAAADQPLPPDGLPPAFQAKAEPAPGTSASAGPGASASPAPSASTSAGPPNPSSPAPIPSTSSSSNPGGPGNPPPPSSGADTTIPAGDFSLTSAALWIGQSITFTQVKVSDNGVWDPGSVTREVAWGDGTTETLLAQQPPVKKAYTKAGTFTITFTLIDLAGNKRVVEKPVTVTQPVKAALDKSSVWNGQRFNVRFSNVPAGTTRITLRYGDGTGIHLPGKNQVIGGMYHLFPKSKGGGLVTGTMRLTAVYANKSGESSQIEIGRITIKGDRWAPRVAITTPKNADRVSSWTTVRGAASDQGSGVQYVSVGLTRMSGNKPYCYTSSKTWVRIVTDAQAQRQCLIRVRAVNGKWALAVRGMKKGAITVSAVAADWAFHSSGVAVVTRSLTR
jgi:hypothetical protein